MEQEYIVIHIVQTEIIIQLVYVYIYHHLQNHNHHSQVASDSYLREQMHQYISELIHNI